MYGNRERVSLTDFVCENFIKGMRMEFLYSYVKNICVFMLVITLILNIFPDRQYIKYIKLFAGLLLIISAITPIINLGKQRIDITKVIDKYYSKEITMDSDISDSVREMQTKVYERVRESNEQATSKLEKNK